MKIHLIRLQLFVLLFSLSFLSMSAHPRIIKGVVYSEGKPASGVHVTVHKSKASYFTSFDGKYEVKAESKSKWIKFSLAAREIVKELDPNEGDYLDIQFSPKKEDNAPSRPNHGEVLSDKILKN
jgi:hypothetical protein